MGPYKCPDCGVWWAGFEHACKPLTIGANTSSFKIGHCHGCSTALCNGNDHVPCFAHQNGWTTMSHVVSYAS